MTVLRRFEWERFLIDWCAAFHLLVAITLTLAPYEQIDNAATEPVFALASRYVWACLFLLAGVCSWWVARRIDPDAHLLIAALAVFPLGTCWLAAFALAVAEGRGSALSVIIWPFLYGPWLIAWVRAGLRKR